MKLENNDTLNRIADDINNLIQDYARRSGAAGPSTEAYENTETRMVMNSLVHVQNALRILAHEGDGRTGTPLLTALSNEATEYAKNQHDAMQEIAVPVIDPHRASKRYGVISAGRYADDKRWTTHVGYHNVPEGEEDPAAWVKNYLYSHNDYDEIEVRVILPYTDFVRLAQDMLGR